VPSVNDYVREVLASNVAGEFTFVTLQFEHPAFTKTHRLVLANTVDMEPMQLGLWSDTDDNLYDFLPVAGESIPPAINGSDVAGYQFTLDGVSLEIAAELDLVVNAAREPLYVTRSEYLESDPTQPTKKPIRLVVVDASVNETRFSCNGQYTDPANLGYPRNVYTVKSHPGLA